MADKLEVKRGVRIDPEEAKAEISQGKISVLLMRPPTDDVEAQYYYSGWTQCPNPSCGQIGWMVGLNSETPGNNPVVCGVCGCHFRV